MWNLTLVRQQKDVDNLVLMYIEYVVKIIKEFKSLLYQS